LSARRLDREELAGQGRPVRRRLGERAAVLLPEAIGDTAALERPEDVQALWRCGVDPQAAEELRALL